MRVCFCMRRPVVIVWLSWCLGAVMLATPLLLVAPVLIQPKYNILDAPLFCQTAQNVRLSDPSTYLNLERFKTRAQYGYLLYMFPCYFSVNAVWRAWFHSGVLLAVSAMLLYYMLRVASGKRWLALVGVPLCLCNPSFTENYYTLFKTEPWLLTGMLGTVVLLHIKLVSKDTWCWWKACAYYVASIVAALFTYSLKETGGSFIVVYVCGTMLISWAHNIDLRTGFARTWPLCVINVVAFMIQVYRFANLPMYYDASGLAGYDVSLTGIAQGIARLQSYVVQTAGYVVPSVLMVTLIVWGRDRQGDMGATLRCRVGWAVFLLYFIAGVWAPFVPWQGIEARQYLIAGTIMPAFALVSIAAAVAVRQWRFLLLKVVTLLVAVATWVLLLAHAGYSFLVGPFSEGKVRHALDCAYDEMYRFIAASTATGGMVHFMMDWALPEPVENTRIAMNVFYKRADIDCVFPRSSGGLMSTGYIAVTDYKVAMNYNRMPLQHEAHTVFYNQVSPHLAMRNVTSFVYETRIWYATNTYHGPQYRSVWGVPAFWDLKRGTYRFGWTIYAITNVPDIPDQVWADEGDNLVVNGGFSKGVTAWSFWGAGAERTNQLAIVRAGVEVESAYALRVENPYAELLGVKQHVPLVSGEVYRLSAAARSVATNASEVLFGGRVAVWLPPQAERELVWMSEYNRWWRKELVFTNQVTGTAVVYVHLGYGRVATTGEFSSIRLERIGRPPR